MKILAVDTATKSCSVAIAADTSLLAEQTLISSETHSKHLMRMIKTVLDLSDLAVSEMDGWAVTLGPGTFTGLRIGVSAVKGLAAAFGKPVAGISSLDALAAQAAEPAGLICPMIDARRGEVYCALYRLNSNVPDNGKLIKEMDEDVLSPDKAIFGIHEPCLFIGNGAALYKQTIIDNLGSLAQFAAPCQNTICASTVARLGIKKLKNNAADKTDTFTPRYLRKSDASLKIKTK